MTAIGTRALMDDIERDVRNRLRRHILKRGGAPEYEDEALFERVRAVLGRAIDERNADALLLPELLDSDVEWELQTHLRLTTHRPVVGRVILLVKRRWVCSSHSTSLSSSSGSSSASALRSSIARPRTARTRSNSASSSYSGAPPRLRMWRRRRFRTSRSMSSISALVPMVVIDALR